MYNFQTKDDIIDARRQEVGDEHICHSGRRNHQTEEEHNCGAVEGEALRASLRSITYGMSDEQ